MRILKEMIEQLFSKLPYSMKNKEAKEAIFKMISELYHKRMANNEAENVVVGEIIATFGSIEQIEKLVPIDYHDQVIAPYILKKQLLQVRMLYRAIAFFIATLMSLCLGIYIYSFYIRLITFVLVIGVIILMGIILRQYRHLRFGTCQLSQVSAEDITSKVKIYKVRLINSIIIFIALFAMQWYTFVSIYNMMNISFYQSAVNSSLWLISIGAYFVVKNSCFYLRYQRMLSLDKDISFLKFIKRFSIGTIIYGLFTIFILVFAHLDAFPFANRLWLAVLVVVYILAFYVYSILKRRSYGVKDYHLPKWKKVAVVFIVVSMGVSYVLTKDSWWIQPYISMIPSVPHEQLEIDYDKQSGVYELTMNDDDFKILQLTDIHLGGSVFTIVKDIEALQAVYTLIERTRPDLVVITGDFVFPVGIMSLSLNNYTPMMQFASFMRNIGIPWAMTYGNHDTEEVATHDFNELEDLFVRFSYENTGNLLYNTAQPDIYGRSNQLIKINDKEGNLNQVLYLLDSNSYVTGMLSDYDYIHDDQVAWYEQTLTEIIDEEGPVNSMLFTHIPLQEYQTAYDLYKQQSPEITYYYGQIGEADEAICASKYHSKMFDSMKAIGSTKGVFVGHDHYNNLSVAYDGIRLTYGMSIDYLAMPGIANRTEQRGGTLITIDSSGQFTSEPVPLK